MKSDQKSARLQSNSLSPTDFFADEILKRLPIKTLGRCRCVCKPWNSLISSSLSIAAHFSAASTSPTTFIHLHRGSCTLHHPPQPLHFPFQFWDIASPSMINYECVDVINGVVCVYHSLFSSFDSAILWNPAIRRYVSLPLLPLDISDEQKRIALEIRTPWRPNRASFFIPNSIGFGYSKNDFKVVRVWIPSSSSPGFEVFSSRRGLWREAKTEPFASLKSCGFVTPATSCFVSGTIHWLLSTSDEIDPKSALSYSLLLLMFDCQREEFRTIDLPEENFLSPVVSNGRVRLLKYSGMVSVLLFSDAEPSLHLWVMKEDQTWFKLLVCEDRHNLLSGYVYEESMFLMDDVKGGKCYAKGETVDIQLHPRRRDGAVTRWRCPPLNWIKLNTHGVFRGKHQLSGVGGVFRDDEGRFVQAFSRKTSARSAFEVQLKGMWEGLVMAQSMKIRSLIVETDSIEVVQALTTDITTYESKLPEGSQLVAVQCEIYIRCYPWRVGVCHAPRESNKVAQWFAETGIAQDQVYRVFKEVPIQAHQFIAYESL